MARTTTRRRSPQKAMAMETAAFDSDTAHPDFDLNNVPAELRERVEDLIPPFAVAENYIHRSIEGVLDFDYADAAIEDRENILLVGPTGSSKTTFFRAYAAYRRLPFALVECNGAMDPGVIIGGTTVAHVEGLAVDEFVYGDFSVVVKVGGVGLVDEINLAHPRIIAAYHQLFSVSRRMAVPENREVIKAAHPLLLGAAMNPGYQGTVRMNEAMSNRLEQTHEWGYLREVEEQLVESSTLLDVAYHIRGLAEVRSPVSTNMLMAFERHYRRWGFDPSARQFVNKFGPGEQNAVERALFAESDNISAQIS